MFRWAGDDPARARTYEECFAGYLEDPVQILSRTFSEVGGYDEMIVMNDIFFQLVLGALRPRYRSPGPVSLPAVAGRRAGNLGPRAPWGIVCRDT